jgi:hypothetical protein
VNLSVRYREVRQRPPNNRRIGIPVLNIKAVNTRDNASPYLYGSLNSGGVQTLIASSYVYTLFNLKSRIFFQKKGINQKNICGIKI